MATSHKKQQQQPHGQEQEEEQKFIRTQDPALTAALEHVGADSYTAHRLKHASAEHIYLTTRRCFVGPIPEGWLKSHRKEWYRHYLHINRGSKRPSFDAGANVGHQKRLTGLDLPGKLAPVRPSFPQPEDVNDEHDTENEHPHDEHENDDDDDDDDDDDGDDDDDDDEDDTATIRPASSIESGGSDGHVVVDSTPALNIPRAAPNIDDPALRRESGIHAEQALSSYNTANTVLPPDTLSPPTPRPLVSNRTRSDISNLSNARNRTRTASASTTSYETASEGSVESLLINEPGAPDARGTEQTREDREDAEGTEQTREERDSAEADGSATPRPPNAGHDNPFRDNLLSPPGHGPDSITSASPLLRAFSPSATQDVRSDMASEPSPHPTAPHVRISDDPFRDSADSQDGESSSPAKPRSSGLVKFAEPQMQPLKREIQLRARLAQHASKRLSRKLTRGKLQDGEIVKMEKMLVRIDVTSGSEQPSDEYDEKDSQRVETRTVEKWREFMVVCRESHEDDAVLCLQMYKTRVIPATNKTKTKKHHRHEILLSPNTVKVNLYSSLDKTLVLWQPKDVGTGITFLRPRTGASAVEWFSFIRSVLGVGRAPTLQVNIPDLNVSLRIDNPFGQFESAQTMAEAGEGDEDAMAITIAAGQAIAGKVVDGCMKMLAATGEWDHILPKWAENDRVGLAWKRYDRLEWIHGANERKMYGTIALQRTHELELRPKQHYPTQIKSLAGDYMTEPAPVEGFLIRLTSQKGNEQKLGKLFFKRLYFTTHNQYLHFLRPAKAAPPPPPKMPMHADNKIPTVKQIADKIPLVYAVNPYPFSNGTIPWLTLDGSSSAKIQTHDQDAYDEASRNASALLNSDGFINLCDVVKVRKFHHGATPADEQVDSGSDVDFDASVPDTYRDDGTTKQVDDDRTFELVMRNGLIVRLQAFSKATKKEWMKRVRALVVYWSIRTKHDMDLFRSTRTTNLALLNIDEKAEAHVGQFAHKWEVARSIASPELYNMCGISSCRSIHRSGVLFRKPRVHRTFVRVHVILAHGHLLIYEDTMRKMTGKKLQHIHHSRIASIDLKDCYLYSGLITEGDLLYQNQTFDANMPGNHALPKLYSEDGWTSADEDASTCFVIWHSQRKGWFRSNKEQDDIKEGDKQDKHDEAGTGGKRSALKRVSQLGVLGRSIVFKARSRAERDHWVLGISDELERLGQGEDVRVVGEDGGAK